jgi:hypothetical protein
MRQTTCSKYYYFFIKSCKILCKNSFNFFLYKNTKMKIKSFECLKSTRNYEKKYLERQMLGRRVVCPANQRIILWIVGSQACPSLAFSIVSTQRLHHDRLTVQGPLKKWTKQFNQSYFLKLQLQPFGRFLGPRPL